MKDGGVGCYDCDKGCPGYMVKNEVWYAAFPEYTELKKYLNEKYPRGLPDKERIKSCVQLCLSCLEARLKRQLTPEDFDLELPINHTIWLGMQMQARWHT